MNKLYFLRNIFPIWAQLVSVRIVLAAILITACSQLPTPPANTFVLKGLVQDPLTRIYTDSTGKEKFADIPEPFRGFYAACSACHSNLAPNTDAILRAKAKMNLNTWAEIVAFGPDRLLTAASGRAMPPAPEKTVPDSQLVAVLGFLSSWSSGGVALQGTDFKQGKFLVGRFCADCHTAAGKNSDQARAWNILPLDTYAEWIKYPRLLSGRLAENHPGGNPMPPPKFSLQPTAAERNILLDWIARNSPNNPDGIGQGTVINMLPDSIVSEGALLNVAYAPARRIVNRYCADCHTSGGKNKDKKDAWGNADVKLDAYAGWLKAQNTLKVRLNPALAISQRPFPLDSMPKGSFSRQPTQAERDTLLTWLMRGSPNTSNGE